MKRKLALVIGVIVVFTIAGIMLCSAYRSSESYRKKKAAETYKMTQTSHLNKCLCTLKIQ